MSWEDRVSLFNFDELDIKVTVISSIKDDVDELYSRLKYINDKIQHNQSICEHKISVVDSYWYKCKICRKLLYR